MKLGNPRSVEAISGNTQITEFDNIPSHHRLVYHHKIKPPVRGGIFMCDISTPLWEFSDSVVLNVPEDDPYERRDGINYDERVEPVAANEFIVPDSEIEDYHDALKSKFSELRDNLYDSASLLNAISESNTYIQAALRDGIDLDFEADAGIYEAFVHLSRLITLTKATELSSLPDRIKELYLEKITELLATDSVGAMSSHDKRSSIRATLTQMQGGAATMHDSHARVRPKEEVDNGTSLGMRRSRIR